MGESLFGGGGKPGFNRVAVPDTNQQRQQAMLDKFYAAFGGGGQNPNVNNQGFQESLSGFYGGAPFQDIAQNFSKVNTFVPRAKPANGYKLIPKKGDSGNDWMNFIPDPLDTMAPGLGYMSRSSLF